MIGEAVQTSKGLKRFSILFVVCALGGIFTNKFIQKTVQSHWVGLNEQMKQQNISVAAPRVVFARYGLPTFGAWIDTVSWRKPEDCRELRIVAKDIFVPIPFFELLISRPKAGAISVSQLIVEHKPDPACERGPLPVTAEAAVEAEWQSEQESSSVSRALTSRQLERQISELRKWRKKIPFSKLEIHSIKLQNILVSGKIISGMGEGAISSSDALDMEFEFRPLVIQKDKKSIATKLDIVATVSDEDIKSKIDWSYDEGHLLWTAQLDKNQNITTQIQLSNLPLSVVNRWLGTPWSFQFLWANCAISLESPLKTFESEQWSASECSVKGPQGEIQITNVSLQSLFDPTNLKVDVLFKDFKVDGVVKGTHQLPLAGVFKKFGTVSGGIYFREKQMKSLLGIKGSEVLFSKNNRRTLQEIPSMDLASTYINKKWNFELSNAVLKDGRFDGVIAAQYDKPSQSWDGRLSIQEIAFSQAVQDIMIGGRISPMSLRGGVVVGPHGKIANMDLRGDFKQAEMDGVTVSDGVFFADHSDEGVRLGMSLGKVDIPRGVDTDWLFVALLDRASLTDKITVMRLHTDAVVSSGKVVIKKVSGTALNGKLALTGEYTSRLQEGTLEWNLPKYQYQWNWVREDGQVTLFPMLDSMREWLRINKDFSKEFQGVRILNQRENKGR